MDHKAGSVVGLYVLILFLHVDVGAININAKRPTTALVNGNCIMYIIIENIKLFQLITYKALENKKPMCC